MIEERTGRVVLMDFGIARAAELAGKTAEHISGTPDYMAPEQVRGREVDARADLYALGCVLYEMLTGERVFRRDTPMAAALAHADDVPPLLLKGVPPRLRRLVTRLLEKDPARRPADAAEVAAALAAPRRRIGTVVVLAAFAALAALAGWLWHRSTQTRWARDVAMPEIERLLAADDYPPAAALARQALAALPGDATVERLWIRATFEVSISSTPPGADVSYRPYRADPERWTHLGTTPLAHVRVPRDNYVWRLSKPGFAPAFEIGTTTTMYYAQRVFKLEELLVPEASVPPDMVAIPGDKVQVSDDLEPVAIDAFFIDRHEVTNEEYKRFVEAGGYRRPELWKEPFVRDGRIMSWNEAMVSFQDATGRPGPSTWELGTYPTGKSNHPVAGVSWYEAAAYARFVGKGLPTVYHWLQAADVYFASAVLPGSNFDGNGTMPVEGPLAMSGHGTYDMAGNVKEWTLSSTPNGDRFVMGGGFGEPSYMFIDGREHPSPWGRGANVGFRCVKLPTAPSAAAVAPIPQTSRDYRMEKPASDELFRAYRSEYLYDRTPLNARVESTDETSDWRRERISFDAAYGGERVVAYLYLPKSARPPFQTVIYYPGSSALFLDKFELPLYFDYIPKTGRALLAPVFKSTFERQDGYSLATQGPASDRDHMVAWSKDLGRSLDYLETRADIDRTRIAYLGLSWGGVVAPIMLAVEDRFKVAVIVAGGMPIWPRILPEIDPVNFIGHVHVPLLVMDGRYDTILRVETSQKPFFDLLGTPAADKQYLVYESGHMPPRREVIRDSLTWLDRYLGPVGR